MRFTSGRIRYVMREDCVIYIESRRNGSIIHGNRNVWPTSYGMSYWSSTLSSGEFFRCHESFIVNLSHALEVRGEDLFLDNGAHVPISRRKRTELLQRLAYLDRPRA